MLKNNRIDTDYYRIEINMLKLIFSQNLDDKYYFECNPIT